MKSPIFSDIPHRDKTQLRRFLRTRRQQLSPNARVQAEQRINRRLKRLIKRHQRIGIYMPVGSECRLDSWVYSAKKRGARLYAPYIESGQLRLWFTPIPDTFQAAFTHRAPRVLGKTGKKSLNIPQFSGKKIRAHHLHALIIPAIGIDSRGHRLGQGGGYYDYTLAACAKRLRPRVIAVAFDCQTVWHFPAETHDAKIGELVCESGHYRLPLSTIIQAA